MKRIRKILREAQAIKIGFTIVKDFSELQRFLDGDGSNSIMILTHGQLPKIK